MVVNACCHRAHNIKGTEIQIKMFDDRLVFESPGKLPGQVKPSNIRNTHFSRNPKIAAFLKAYHYVKEFGEGMDRICREQEANGAQVPYFRTDDFILKITVPKVTETEQKSNRKVIGELSESEQKRTETEQKPNRNRIVNGVKMTETRITMLQLMKEDPYISKAKLAEILGIHPSAVSRNIEAMRGKCLRRVGADRGGFWETIEETWKKDTN